MLLFKWKGNYTVPGTSKSDGIDSTHHLQCSGVDSKHTTHCTLPNSVHEVTARKKILALNSQIKTATVLQKPKPRNWEELKTSEVVLNSRSWQATLLTMTRIWQFKLNNYHGDLTSNNDNTCVSVRLMEISKLYGMVYFHLYNFKT